MAFDEDGSRSREDRLPVVLYAALSLDGYVAEPDDGLGFLDEVAEAEPTYDDFYAGVSALVMGRRTYDVVRSFGIDWPYPDKPCVVVTSRAAADAPADVSFDDGRDLAALVRRLSLQARTRAGGPGRIWLVGGGALARSMLAAQLLDEIDLVVTPHVLGGGVPLWGTGSGRHRLHLLEVRDLGCDAVRVRYRVDHG